MAAPLSVTRDYGTNLSLANDRLEKKGKTQDAIFKSNPTLAFMMEKGRYVDVGSGEKIMVNLMYGKNATAKSINEYGTVDTTPTDPITRAWYDRAIYTVQLNTTKTQVSRNSGAHQIVKLVDELRRNATMSLSEQLNEDLWAGEGLTTAVTGNGGLNIISIPMIAPALAVGSNNINIGGISPPTYTWWHPQYTTTARTTWALLHAGIRKVKHDCSKGSGGVPDISISTQNAYESFEASLQTDARYTNNPPTATIDFESITAKGIRLYWDEHVPDAYGSGTDPYDWDSSSFTTHTIYMLNTKFLALGYDPEFNFTYTPFSTPEDQPLVLISSGIWVGQLLCYNRRKHGVVSRISADLTS